MKIRNGFVSNSSSASFVISKADITEEQLDMIKRAITPNGFSRSPFYAKLGFIGCLITEHDAWDMREDSEHIYGESTMDNGNIWPFFKSIGVGKECVKFYDEDSWEDSDVY
jgi:hypothetical protein